MLKNDYLNNIGIGIISIIALENKCKKMDVDQAVLILPFITHKRLLSYLANKKTNIISIEKLISERPEFFLNFNKRYYDSLTTTMNSIQYLIDMGYLCYKENKLISLKELQYNESMGKRVALIYGAVDNLVKLMAEDINNLYLNLRIEL